MIIHLPTGKKFHNRKEAKIYFGTAYYYKMEREKRDLMFTNYIQSATNAVSYTHLEILITKAYPTHKFLTCSNAGGDYFLTLLSI